MKKPTITLDKGALDHVPFVNLAKFLAQHDCRFEQLPNGEIRIVRVPQRRNTYEANRNLPL